MAPRWVLRCSSEGWPASRACSWAARWSNGDRGSRPYSRVVLQAVALNGLVLVGHLAAWAVVLVAMSGAALSAFADDGPRQPSARGRADHDDGRGGGALDRLQRRAYRRRPHRRSGGRWDRSGRDRARGRGAQPRCTGGDGAGAIAGRALSTRRGRASRDGGRTRPSRGTAARPHVAQEECRRSGVPTGTARGGAETPGRRGRPTSCPIAIGMLRRRGHGDFLPDSDRAAAGERCRPTRRPLRDRGPSAASVRGTIGRRRSGAVMPDFWLAVPPGSLDGRKTVASCAPYHPGSCAGRTGAGLGAALQPGFVRGRTVVRQGDDALVRQSVAPAVPPATYPCVDDSTSRGCPRRGPARRGPGRCLVRPTQPRGLRDRRLELPPGPPGRGVPARRGRRRRGPAGVRRARRARCPRVARAPASPARPSTSPSSSTPAATCGRCWTSIRSGASRGCSPAWSSTTCDARRSGTGSRSGRIPRPTRGARSAG